MIPFTYIYISHRNVYTHTSHDIFPLHIHYIILYPHQWPTSPRQASVEESRFSRFPGGKSVPVSIGQTEKRNLVNIQCIYIIRYIYIYMYVTYNVQISYVYVYIYIHNVIDIDIIRINMLYYVICL